MACSLIANQRKYKIGTNLVIEQLRDKASRAVLNNGNTGEWFCITVRVRQGYLFSPILFHIVLERVMTDALEEHIGTISFGGRMITNFQLTDDTVGLADKEEELSSLVQCLNKTSTIYGLEINAEKIIN